MELVSKGHHRFCPRVFEREGPVLDVGCLGWDWSMKFAGKKHVVGYDPQETTVPEWAELHRKAVSITDGTMMWRDREPRTGVGAFTGSEDDELFQVDTVSFASVLKKHEPSLVKLNVEGMEYSLLSSVQHPVADQLIVSFHGFFNQRWRKLDNRFVDWLRTWYEAEEVNSDWGWWVFLKRHDI